MYFLRSETLLWVMKGIKHKTLRLEYTFMYPVSLWRQSLSAQNTWRPHVTVSACGQGEPSWDRLSENEWTSSRTQAAPTPGLGKIAKIKDSWRPTAANHNQNVTVPTAPSRQTESSEQSQGAAFADGRWPGEGSGLRSKPAPGRPTAVYLT